MHAAEAVSSPLSPTAMAVTRCDRSSYKKSLFSRIRVSPRTTSLGLRPLRRFPSPSQVTGLCGIEPLRDGQAHRSLCLFPPAREVAWSCVPYQPCGGQGSEGERGEGGGRGRGSASAEVNRRAVDIATSRRTTHTKTIAVHLVNCQNSCCARGEGALTECEAGEGREWAPTVLRID